MAAYILQKDKVKPGLDEQQKTGFLKMDRKIGMFLSSLRDPFWGLFV
jgi:hypothetical protein